MNRKGQALVEFVLILPIFILMLFAIVDFGMILSKKNELENMQKQNTDIELKKVEYDYDIRKEANKIKEKIETKKV